MMCPCAGWKESVNRDPHECVWVLPWQAGALVARPIQTIHTWRKRGRIGSRKHPKTGLWQVCNCEAAAQSKMRPENWRA